MRCAVLCYCLSHALLASDAGWWNGGLSVEFLRHHFSSRKAMEKPELLVWDDFSGHWTRDVIEYAAAINVELMRVPPSSTSVSQPADISWNHPLKQHMRASWLANLREQLARRDESIQFKLAPPTRPQLCEWIRQAWGSVSSETVQAGFRRAGFGAGAIEIDSEVVRELEQLNLAGDAVCSDDEL